MKHVWIGMCDAGGYTVIAVSDDQQLCKTLLLDKWRQAVGREFQPKIKTFNALWDWNGACVQQMDVNTVGFWETMESAR